MGAPRSVNLVSHKFNLSSIQIWPGTACLSLKENRKMFTPEMMRDKAMDLFANDFY